MRLSISALSFELTDAIAQHVKGRIELSLGTAFSQVKSISVRLTDINGNHGGPDKRCQIVVGLPHFRTVVTEAVDSDLYTAVDLAARRAKEAVWRHLKRRQTLRREHASRFLRRVPA